MSQARRRTRAPVPALSTRPSLSRTGFTLVEVLIAVAIVALLSVLGYRALSALADSEEKLSAEATRWRMLDLFFARLEGDVRQAIPRAARFGDTREPPWLGATDAAGNTLLAFSRAGPEFALEPSSAGGRLTYRLRDGTVEVLYWGSYDRPRGAEAAAYPLITGVSSFRLAYLAKSGSWLDSWPQAGESDLPRALKADLTLASGETIERWLALH